MFVARSSALEKRQIRVAENKRRNRTVQHGSATGQCNRAVQQGSATQQCNRAVQQGSATQQCNTAVQQGSATRQVLRYHSTSDYICDIHERDHLE